MNPKPSPPRAPPERGTSGGKTVSWGVLRRLNRNELEHSLHDLLTPRADLKGMIPEDKEAGGFDKAEREALEYQCCGGHYQPRVDSHAWSGDRKAPPSRVGVHPGCTSVRRGQRRLVFFAWGKMVAGKVVPFGVR
jgi:hypothetical protein